MRKATFGFTLALLFAGVSAAQEWEVGGMASYGFYRNTDLTGGPGSASAGFASGPAFGAVIGYNSTKLISGEFRYSYAINDLQLSSAGQTVKFGGAAHMIGYDLILHPRVVHEGKVQPFLAVGGGMKLYRGTGDEQAFQPLENFALLSKTQQVEPMISVGGGIKVQLSRHVLLRAEVRDYISPFPTSVIVPVPPARIGGWLNEFVPMIGISYTFQQ